MVSTLLTDAIGAILSQGIRAWVRYTGQRVTQKSAPWLKCPMGPLGRIGAEYYPYLAARENLTVQPSPEAGLVPSFELLRGPSFDPDAIDPRVRDFYEHTSAYRLEAWSESGPLTKVFLWGLTTFVSRRMDQLNFPVSPLELAGGMSSEVIPMFDVEGNHVYTGWLRRLLKDNRVIYTGLYGHAVPPNYDSPCVKVSFPLPRGSSTVFLRPEAQPDGSLKLISEGNRLGDPGFYRMLELRTGVWYVRYIRTLRESFHVYLDDQDILRTEHQVNLLGLRVLKLFYKLERLTA